MKCNLFNYLDQEEMTCLRIAKSCDDGTLAQAEWLRTAQMLLDSRTEHVKVCKKCREK